MYDRPDAGETTSTIYRFMIDKRHQGQGFGRLALAAALAEIEALPGVATVAICYMPDNHAARNLYGAMGFREVGLDEDGEMIAHLPLRAESAQ
jgi:diamine N-acetyltransferase